MELILNRRAGVAVKDQLVYQLEMKIVSGEWPPGHKLPSVRALARRLKLHANTVSAAYRELETTGRVAMRPGSGVYVSDRGVGRLEDAEGLDSMIRLALHKAFDAGYSGDEIRRAVERWLDAAPPDRVVVVDPVLDLARLLAAEVGVEFGIDVAALTPEAAEADPTALAGPLVLSNPLHFERIRAVDPRAAIEEIHLDMSAEAAAAMRGLAEGSVALLISVSDTVLSFGTVLLRSLRGDEIHVEVRRLDDPSWKRMVRGCDLVLADIVATPVVARARPRRLQTARLLKSDTIDRIRYALREVVPRDRRR